MTNFELKNIRINVGKLNWLLLILVFYFLYSMSVSKVYAQAAFQTTGTVTCDANNNAFFQWSAEGSGKTVVNYSLRINKTGAGVPDTTTPASTPRDGDRLISVGNNINALVALVAGQYVGWTVQVVYSDNTQTTQSSNLGSFACPTGSGGPTPTPTASPATTGYITDKVKVVEDNTRNSIPVDDPIWDNTNLVIEKKYSDVTGQKLPLTLRDIVCVTTPCDTTPSGDRWVHVLFIGRDPSGAPVKKSESSKIYLALEPKIDAINCDISASGGTSISINGSHFGQNMGSVKVGDQNAPVSATTWGNLSVTTTFSSQIAGGETVTLTTPEGQSKSGQCTLGKSQIDFTASLACRSVSKALSTASIEVKEAAGVGLTAPVGAGASVYKQDNQNFDSSGHPQGVLPDLAENKDYILTIQAPSSLRKTIPFKAKKGTNVLEALDLPLGDIAPERPDCKINALDFNRLKSEWASNSDATSRRSDLNQDGRVNSIDYACLRSNFDKVCDSP